MNFERMPLLKYEHGFGVFCALTIFTSCMIAVVFRRYGWWLQM